MARRLLRKLKAKTEKYHVDKSNVKGSKMLKCKLSLTSDNLKFDV